MFLLALLNSKLFNYFYKDISQEKEGRTFAQVKTTYIKQLPVIKPDNFGKIIFETVVRYLLLIKRTNSNINHFFESLIDAMVYKLYFPNKIKAVNCEILKHLNDLPELKDDWSHEKKIKTIEKTYKELSDPAHPVFIAMKKMKTVPEVKIIEGLDK
jgi:hypothetical protein